MNPQESNPNEIENSGKPIENFKADIVDGQDVLGGFKTNPIIIIPDLQDLPLEFESGTITIQDGSVALDFPDSLNLNNEGPANPNSHLDTLK